MENKYLIYRTIFLKYPTTLREIARDLGISPSSVHRALREFMKKKLIKIEPLGNLNLIFPNFNNILGKYYALLGEIFFFLKKVQEMPEILDFIDDSNIIILYGSRADNYYLDTSDYDILRLWKDISKKDFLKGLKEDPFIKSIVKRHVVLKGFEEWVDFLWKSSCGASK